MIDTNDLGAWRTRRFPSYVIGMIALSCLGGICVALRADSALVAIVLAPLLSLATAALGFGAWHDKNVRTEIVRADKEKAVAITTADLQRHLSSDIPRSS